MDSNVDTWVRDSRIPFMNIRGMFFAHFIFLVFAMVDSWVQNGYLFYNLVFMYLLASGLIYKDKSEHLELALVVDGMSVVFDICSISLSPHIMGTFSTVMAIFNLLLRFISFFVIRNEVNLRGGESSLTSNSFGPGGPYQDIDSEAR